MRVEHCEARWQQNTVVSSSPSPFITPQVDICATLSFTLQEQYNRQFKFMLKKRSLICLLAVQKYTRTESFAGCFYIHAVSYIQFISLYILFTLHLRVDYIQVRDEGIVLVAVKSPVISSSSLGGAVAILSLRGHFEEQMQFLDLNWSVSLTCAPAAAFCRDLGPR